MGGATNAHHGHNQNAQGQNYSVVNSSFNEQLMNQTNFGFNPQRQTIVSTPNATSGNHNSHHGQKDNNMMFIEPIANVRDRRELNTQKRNLTQTIQIESPINNGMNMHQRGGSLNIQELYSHYHSKAKSSGQPSTRVASHQPQITMHNQNNGGGNGPHHPQAHPHVMQNNMMGGAQFNSIGDGSQNPQQLFLPVTMKMQVVARKQPVTQHQQHRSHSVNNQQV